MRRFGRLIAAIVALLVVSSGLAVAADHALVDADHHRFERGSDVPPDANCMANGIDHTHETSHPCAAVGVTSLPAPDDQFAADFGEPHGSIPPAIERPPAA